MVVSKLYDGNCIRENCESLHKCWFTAVYSHPNSEFFGKLSFVYVLIRHLGAHHQFQATHMALSRTWGIIVQ
jgi:hypothetical protein